MPIPLSITWRCKASSVARPSIRIHAFSLPLIASNALFKRLVKTCEICTGRHSQKRFFATSISIVIWRACETLSTKIKGVGDHLLKRDQFDRVVVVVSRKAAKRFNDFRDAIDRPSQFCGPSRLIVTRRPRHLDRQSP